MSQYLFFSRSGFSEPPRLYVQELGAQLVDLVKQDTVPAQATR